MRIRRLWAVAAFLGLLALAVFVPPLILNTPLLLAVPIALGAYGASRHYGGLRHAILMSRISFYRWSGMKAPFPGWPGVSGGATPPAVVPPPASPPGSSMTKAELGDFIKSIAGDLLGPAVTNAIAPLAKSQGDVMEKILAGINLNKGAAPDHFDDATLGKYPIGRKARVVALAAIDGIPLKDVDALQAMVKKHWRLSHSEPTVKWLDDVKKKTSLSASVSATAGDMVLPEYDSEWIELLRNSAVIRGIARTIPMPRGATSRRKQTSAGIAYYQGELEKITPSNLTVGRVALSYKKLTALTVVTNDLIRFSSGEADRIVQEDLLRVSALREDQAFLVGNPPIDAGNPTGIRYQTKAANIYASAGASLANFQADLTKAIRLVQAGNVPATPANSYFILSPSTFWTIYALATTTGDMIFAAMLSAPMPRLFGFPVLLTTQLETSNSFIGANAGMVIFAYGPALEIHDSLARTVEAWRGGAYYDPALAAVASGISNDETVITCIAEHDFLQVYDAAASIVTGYAT